MVVVVEVVVMVGMYVSKDWGGRGGVGGSIGSIWHALGEGREVKLEGWMLFQFWMSGPMYHRQIRTVGGNWLQLAAAAAQFVISIEEVVRQDVGE